MPTDQLMRVFDYEGGHRIRTIIKDGEPWFVAKDVIEALGIGNVTETLKRLDEDEFSSTEVVDSAGRRQAMYIVNEPGLYSLILGARSFRDPERAERVRKFKRWVTHEVLPSIRKTGAYVAKGAKRNTDNRLRELEVEARVRNARVREARMLHTMAKDFADILSPEAKQAMLSHATLVLTGERLIPLPKVEEPLFTAEEIAAELGVSANKVGRVANKYGLKTAEYGVWVLDKAKHCDKQVRTFLYNVRGREAVIEAVKRDMRMIPGDKE